MTRCPEETETIKVKNCILTVCGLHSRKWHMPESMRNPNEAAYHVDLFRLVKAGCEEAIRAHAASEVK